MRPVEVVIDPDRLLPEYAPELPRSGANRRPLLRRFLRDNSGIKCIAFVENGEGTEWVSELCGTFGVEVVFLEAPKRLDPSVVVPAPPVEFVAPPPLSDLLAGLPPFTYVGRVDCLTGYGAAARHQVWLLRRHGLRLVICGAGSSGKPDPQARSPFVQSCLVSDRGPGVKVLTPQETAGTIIHLAPNMARRWHKTRDLPRPHVLVSVWETTRLPQAWVEYANDYDQVWCATHWQAQVYAESGVDPSRLRYVPFGLDPAVYDPKGPVRDYDEKACTFGSVFQWTERKAPQALIAAYLSAFPHGENVRLVLKTYPGDTGGKSVRQCVQEIVARYRGAEKMKLPQIEVFDEPLDQAGVDTFVRGLSCLVSSHRGEGFGLPIAEALLLGIPVIATDWSAPAEYAAGLYMPVSYTLEPPSSMEWQPIYTLDQLWAHPDVAQMAQWMREVYHGRAKYDYSQVRTQFEKLCDLAGRQAADALKDLTLVTP